MIFVSCFTIEPNHERANDYLEEFEKIVLSSEGSELWVTGYQAQYFKSEKSKDSYFESSAELIKEL